LIVKTVAQKLRAAGRLDNGFVDKDKIIETAFFSLRVHEKINGDIIFPNEAGVRGLETLSNLKELTKLLVP